MFTPYMGDIKAAGNELINIKKTVFQYFNYWFYDGPVDKSSMSPSDKMSEQSPWYSGDG